MQPIAPGLVCGHLPTLLVLEELASDLARRIRDRVYVDVEQAIGRSGGESRNVGDPRAVTRTITGNDVFVQEFEVEKGAIH